MPSWEVLVATGSASAEVGVMKRGQFVDRRASRFDTACGPQNVTKQLEAGSDLFDGDILWSRI
jgi:hypothetical protein